MICLAGVLTHGCLPHLPTVGRCRGGGMRLVLPVSWRTRDLSLFWLAHRRALRQKVEDVKVALGIQLLCYQRMLAKTRAACCDLLLVTH